MRKNRNIVVLICSIIMVLGVLAGCSSQNASTSTNAGSNATQAVQATPSVEPSTAEVTSSEALEPASQESTVAETASSAEAVVDNENIIDGIDFTTYNNSEVPIDVCLSQQNAKFDRLTAIITIHRNEKNEPMSKVEQISYDGDSYVGKIDSKVVVFYYGAKKIEKSESSSKNYTVGMNTGYPKGIFDSSYTGGENEEITCTVTYEDGTQESITLYFTLE